MTITQQFSLQGKRALVTGASRGLGLAMAKGLAEAGATVYINSRVAATLETQARAAQSQGINLHPLPFDVEDEAAAATALNELEAKAGGLDILINNVGVRDRRGMFDLSSSDFQKLLNNHVVTAFNLVKLAAPMMQKRGGGRVINMLSVVASRAAPSDPAYIAAKGALASLTRAQAVDLGAWGINVNAITPGAFATEVNRELAQSEQGQTMVSSRSCLNRWGEVDEIAGAAVFLASPSASYITGQVLAVDGGVLAKY